MKAENNTEAFKEYPEIPKKVSEQKEEFKEEIKQNTNFEYPQDLKPLTYFIKCTEFNEVKATFKNFF
jgi:hypothetical protein